MKRLLKKTLAFLIAVSLMCTAGTFMLQTQEVKAASGVYINPYSANKVVTYKPGSSSATKSDAISIIGCDKASQIKNLKSSNTSIAKVEPKAGYIRVIYGKKAGKVKISCTVKGKKLSTTYTVKKYSNPLSVFKIGNSNFVSKYAKNDTYRQKKAFKSQTLNIKAKSGWKIMMVHVNNGSTTRSYSVKKSSFSKKISLSASYAYVAVTFYNSKTKVEEYLTFHKSNY